MKCQWANCGQSAAYRFGNQKLCLRHLLEIVKRQQRQLWVDYKAQFKVLDDRLREAIENPILPNDNPTCIFEGCGETAVFNGMCEEHNKLLSGNKN